jgi:homoaconitase/3-isopropylmalate dehydratase large subunit/3-isopropylmalate dehydratase small subunit
VTRTAGAPSADRSGAPGRTAIEGLLGGRAGEEVDVPLDLIVSDDWTTPSLLAPLGRLGTERPAAPVVIVHDHTQAPERYAGEDRARAERLVAVRDAFARRYGAEVIEGRGIQHHVLAEMGRLRPGIRVLGNDSHAPTLGAHGVAAFAGQPATVAAALHTGRLVTRVPETLRIVVTGRLRPGVSARDAALALLERLRDDDGVPRRSVGKALEFVGPGTDHLSAGERAVLANVAPEAVAATAVFPGNAGTRSAAPRSEGDQDLLEFDLADVRPGVARGPDPTDVVPLEAFEATRVDRVFVGTCAGGTYEEIAAFASALTGPVAVPTQVAPASDAVVYRLEQTGALARLRRADVELLPPGCGACFGFGAARLSHDEVAVTTGNRNGRGRMGSPRATIHLASGRTAGIAAATGRIGSDAAAVQQQASRAAPSVVWPRRGNVLRLHGTITTDDLTPSTVPGVGSSHDAEPEVLRRLLLHHLDATAAERDLRGSVVVADDAFGMGSNRASSVLALQAAGVSAVIARSLAPLYAAGARDAGFLALELDDDAFFDLATPDATVRVEANRGLVHVAGRTFGVAAASRHERGVRAAGGIVAYLLSTAVETA